MGEIWGLALGAAAGGIIGGVISAQGAQSAAQTQASAAENAQQISLQEFNTITGQEQPYMQAGYGALSNLDYLLGINPQTSTGGAPGAPAPAQSPYAVTGPNYRMGPNGSIIPILSGGVHGAPATPTRPSSIPGGTFGSLLTPFNASYMQQYSPAYKFQLQQGQQGVLNQDASSQGALSGAALKDLISYNQNYANTAFSNAFNQYQTQQGLTYSRLADIAQLGQSAAANTGQQGTALAGQQAQSATNVGTALAAGQVGAANAYGGAASNLGLLAGIYGQQAGGFGVGPNGYGGAGA
jgi:hypothetical protein